MHFVIAVAIKNHNISNTNNNNSNTSGRADDLYGNVAPSAAASSCCLDLADGRQKFSQPPQYNGNGLFKFCADLQK